MYAMFRKASDTIISPSKMATIMTPPSDEGPATTTVGRSRRKRFSLAGLNLGSAVSKVAEKEASEKNNCDKGCGSADREGIRSGTGRTSSSSATSLLSPKASASADAVGNSNISASTAVASRDPRARRGSLPIFDRISTCAPTPSSTRSKEEMGHGGRVKEADDSMLGGRSGGGSGDVNVNGNGNGSSSSTAAVATCSGIGAEVTANADFERRGPPRRRHSASATQIEAISRQAFGGGDAAAYESDSSSDSSAWLDSDSDSDDED